MTMTPTQVLDRIGDRLGELDDAQIAYLAGKILAQADINRDTTGAFVFGFKSSADDDELAEFCAQLEADDLTARRLASDADDYLCIKT